MRNLKKVIALVAVFAMMVTSVAFAQSYSDVKEDDNYYEAIEMLSKLNILTGDDKDGDGVMDFRPNDTITRAEVAAVICRIQDLNNLSQTTTPFTDVPSSHWASGYVAQAAGQGIINGYGDGNFGPEDDVTYEQAVKMFVETLGYTPFVNANGGYPTGHLTAAQRYGVVDGVVGASVGAKATRGQIAQIAFNAIDTPIMDRSSYGKDEEFTIFDGTNNKSFETLLTRDLKVKKFAGVITENNITSLNEKNTIDTDKKAEIKIDYEKNGSSLSTDNYNYEVDKMTTVYAAESGAEKLLGYFVDGYAKETDRSGEYDIISVAASNKNKTLTFTLDQFDSLENGKINYYKNDNDNKTTSATLQLSSGKMKGIIYNGVAISNDPEDVFSQTGAKNDKYVWKNSTYSGKVTLIDNDSTNGYDVALVDISASAVVDSVSAAGKVTFLNSPRRYDGDNSTTSISLDFDEDDNSQIIELTKDGKAMNYADLKKWDVLSIYSNEDYYVVKVVGENKIDGSISNKGKSDTSADTCEYTIDGKTYDVAENAYGIKKNGWSAGTAGVFYIDDNNKIVAYDKNGSTTTSNTNGNYAYILNASVSSDGFNKVVSLQILDKSGKVFTDDLYERVKFENGKNVVATALGETSTSFDDEQSYKIENHETELAKVLKNRFVTYETNSSNEVKTITFWNDATEDDNTLYLEKAGDSYNYDEENKEITIGTKKYDVDDDTVVFFVKADSGVMGAKAADLTATATASKTASKVGKITDIGDGGAKTVSAVFDVDNGVVGAVLLFDATSGISSTTGIAVIDSVGDGTYNGDNTKTVTFFKDGAKVTASIDPDLNETDGIEDAKKGDLYKFAVSADGQLITSIRKYATVTRYGNGLGDITFTDAKDKAGSTGVLTVTPGSSVDPSLIESGVVYDYSSSNKRIRIATPTSYDFGDTTSIKCSDANVYVVDPSKKNNKVSAGDAGDVEYDKYLIEKDDDTANQKKVVKKDTAKTVLVNAGDKALGMMDFVVAIYNNDGDVVDVVIYKPYDFGKYDIVE